MEQYIQKDALKAEIESKKKCAQILGDNAINSSMQQFYDGMKQGCVDILSTLDTLEMKEVEINKEISQFIDANFEKATIGHKLSLRRVAKHFFELGLNAQRKIGYVPNIDDSLKELGVDPSSKEAKIFKESYCAALDKFMTQKGE